MNLKTIRSIARQKIKAGEPLPESITSTIVWQTMGKQILEEIAADKAVVKEKTIKDKVTHIPPEQWNDKSDEVIAKKQLKKETIYVKEIDDGDEDRKITKFEISLKAVTIEVCDTREQAEKYAADNGYNIKFI